MPPLFTVKEAILFKQQIQRLCQQDEEIPQRIVLDFGRTTFIDSSGVGALVSCQKTAKAKGIALIFWSFAPQVEMVLAMTGLDKVFIVDHQTKAILPPDNITPINPKPQLASPTHPSVKSRMKRYMDILGALVGLSITAMLFPAIAIVIKLDSPGPIFFSQIRCGWMGKKFRLWKFRSMVPDAEQVKHLVQNEISGPLFKNTNDPRITRFGRFLRRTSLDELPQFWNVLKGEMSLVGTRPPTPEEIEIYEVPEWQRLDVKPGLTGEWQVYGRSSVKSFAKVIELDLRYQQNWSLLYDIRLILKTIQILFTKHSGAV
jgi:anti-anti-sigma factor